MMERTLCVWYPDWALRRPDAPQDEPAQAVGEDNRIVAVNAAAADKKRVKVIFDAISTYLLCLMVTHKCLSHETARKRCVRVKVAPYIVKQRRPLQVTLR